MQPIDQAKFTMMVIGIGIWAWGAKNGRDPVMLTGIGFVVVAFALRFLKRPVESEEDDQ